MIYKAKDTQENFHHFIKLAKNRQGRTGAKEFTLNQYYQFKQLEIKPEIQAVADIFNGDVV
jgi:hypothetical protein